MKKTIFAGILTACLFFCGCQPAGQTNASQTESTASNRTSQSSQKTDDPQASPSADSHASTPAESTETPDQESTEGTKILVVYFSRTGEQYGVGNIDKGNTAIVAEMIAEQTGADMYEILPQEDYYPYTYNELTDIAKQEQNENARPAIKDAVPDLSQYDTVFIGAPVWWGDWPMILYTFFDSNQDALAGKNLVPFCTHAGSGLSGFDSKLANACPNSSVKDGLAISGTDAQNDPQGVRDRVSAWIMGLNL